MNHLRRVNRAFFGVALATLLSSPAAFAQRYETAASMQTASGLEGAGRGLSRARTRIRAAVELRIDESRDEGVSFAGLVDLEPRAAVGFDGRYVHNVGHYIVVSGGAVGYVAPGTLLGGIAGVDAKVPVGARTYFVGGPDFAVFALGSDLPNNTIAWQVLLQAGFRVDL